MQSNRKNAKWRLALIGLYVAAVAIRFVLACLTRKSVSITIDEHLYTSLARSIASGDGLLFRGQTADYSYLTFPFFLAPVYALFPSGTNYFRVLQLWCNLLMQTSVFPIYGIAARLFGEQGKKPLIAAALCLLLPDFIFGNVIFSECLIYPLFFMSIYLALREAETPRLSNAVGIGLCAGLLYETKPGQVVFPVVFVLLSVFWALRSKNRKALRDALVSLVLGAAIVFLFRLLSGDGSFGVYRKQLTLDTAHFSRFLYGIFLYPICFILACGVGCFVRPLQEFGNTPKPARRVLLASLISLAVLVVGTSWVVNRYEYANSQLHTRYIAMFIPVMLLYTCAALKNQGEAKPDFRIKTALAGLVIVLWCVAAFFLPQFFEFRNKNISSYYAAFSILNLMSSPDSTMWIRFSAILIPAATAAMFALLCLRKRFVGYISVGVIVVIMGVNSYLGYNEVYNSLANNELIYESGTDILYGIGDDDYVFIGSDFQYGSYNLLSVNSRQQDSYVLWTDMFNALNETQGVYRPFVPTLELRGTLQDRELMDTDLLVMDDTVFKLLKPSASTKVISTPKLYAVRITPGERWVDSMIGNVVRYELEKGMPGILVILDEELLKAPIRVRLFVKCDQYATMRVLSERETVELSLEPGGQWVEAQFNQPLSAYNFITDDCMIYVYDYDVLN